MSQAATATLIVTSTDYDSGGGGGRTMIVMVVVFLATNKTCGNAEVRKWRQSGGCDGRGGGGGFGDHYDG